MKVFALASSPRRSGNSETLLDEALKGARDAGAEVEKLAASDVEVHGCRGCNACSKEGICIIKDQMKEILDKLRSADILIVATPLFFMSMPSQAKAIIDRCQPLWVEKYLLRPKHPEKYPVKKRIGAMVALGGTDFKDMFYGIRQIIQTLYICLDGKIVRELTYKKVDAKGAIKEVSSALDRAYQLGKELVLKYAQLIDEV